MGVLVWINVQYGFSVWSLGLNFALVVTYQHIVAMLYGLTVIPVNDQTTFISSSRAHLNCMSLCGLQGHYDKAWFDRLFTRYITNYDKLRNRIEMKFGDVYYKQLSVSETHEKAVIWEDDPRKTLKSQYEIDCYIRDNLNIKMPLDGPQWRVYGQIYRNSDGKDELILIWKEHHSLMDGISAIMMSTAMSNEYKEDYFIPTKDVSLANQLLLKATAPLYVFAFLWDATFMSRDANIITANKKKMNGKINVATSPKIEMEEVKALSKRLGVTINDVMLCALSASLS